MSWTMYDGLIYGFTCGITICSIGSSHVSDRTDKLNQR